MITPQVSRPSAVALPVFNHTLPPAQSRRITNPSLSLAVPTVTGTASLILSGFPSLSNDQVRSALRLSFGTFAGDREGFDSTRAIKVASTLHTINRALGITDE
jgi:subtilisin family serine protease